MDIIKLIALLMMSANCLVFLPIHLLTFMRKKIYQLNQCKLYNYLRIKQEFIKIRKFHKATQILLKKMIVKIKNCHGIENKVEIKLIKR
jgi:hypothetical protein